MAVAFKNDQNYDKALENFNRILENNIVRKKNPSFYALVLDNYAHTKFLLNQTEELPGLYYEALKICDSVNDTYKPIEINMHLSEYYQSIKNI